MQLWIAVLVCLCIPASAADPTPTPAPAPAPAPAAEPFASVSKTAPFSNSLDMKFVPAGTPGVLLSDGSEHVLRASCRCYGFPKLRTDAFGFRCVLDLPAQHAAEKPE